MLKPRTHYQTRRPRKLTTALSKPRNCVCVQGAKKCENVAMLHLNEVKLLSDYVSPVTWNEAIRHLPILSSPQARGDHSTRGYCCYW